MIPDVACGKDGKHRPNPAKPVVSENNNENEVEKRAASKGYRRCNDYLFKAFPPKAIGMPVFGD